MARELKGYARKAATGRVPYIYGSLRGVTPPVGYEEMQQHQRSSATRRFLDSQ